MKIRIGGGSWDRIDPNARLAADAFSKKISDGIVKAVFTEARELSRTHLKRLEAVVKQAALQEADDLFSTVAELISRDRVSSLSYSDLMRGQTLAKGLNAPGGTLKWAGLSLNWQRRKKRRWPANTNKFFVASSRLRTYLQRQGKSIVRNRFGGVKVETDLKGLSQGIRGGVSTRPYFPGDTDGESLENVVGRVRLTIFPHIAPGLLPMLASNRWTSGSDGDFEYAMFPAATARKLVNADNPHRQLMLPITQFWIQVRIPSQVQKRVSTLFQKTRTNAG